jgi:hypothetical protein
MLDLGPLVTEGIEFKHSVENESIYKIGALVVIILILNKLIERYL